MSQVSHVEAKPKASKPSAQNGAGTQDAEERFTPLLTRERYTFSRMRIDARGDRAFSALCLPRWKQEQG
jgi:hypothetical protein